VSRVGHSDHWPIVLIDVPTGEGVVGMTYLDPFVKDAARYIVPAVRPGEGSKWGAESSFRRRPERTQGTLT